MQSIHSLLLLYLSIHFQQSDGSSIVLDTNTKLVIVGARHGNRNPSNFFRQNPQTWGFEGENELTSVILYSNRKVRQMTCLVWQKTSIRLGSIDSLVCEKFNRWQLFAARDASHFVECKPMSNDFTVDIRRSLSASDICWLEF